MPLPSSSKQKSARTWWGYHAATGPREQRMGRLCLLAGVSGVVVLLMWLPFATSPQGTSPLLETWASPGHVADVHKAWNQDCEACHQPFQPIRSGRSAAVWLGTTVGAWSRHPATANDKCQHCHAAPSHHSNQLAEEIGNCADCHQDHKGLMQSLVDLDDSKCLRCHEDLKNHAKNPEHIRADVATIREFATRHPEFRTADPAEPRHRRGLKFSHAVHMMPGMGLQRLNPKTDAVDEGGPFRYSQIDARLRPHYQHAHDNPGDDAPVQLLCTDCHQLDALRLEGLPAADESIALPVEGIDPVRGDGRYYLPVIYEKHCQGCHPLGFDPEVPSAVVAHGLQPKAVQTEVLEHFSERFLTGKLKEKLRKPEDLRVDPLPELLTDAEKAEIAEQARKAMEAADADLYAVLAWAAPDAKDKIDKAAIQLFKGRKTCGECHSGTGHLTDGSPAPRKINPVNIPTIWQTKARFDHVAHQAIACKLCHPNSVGSRADTVEGRLADLEGERQRAREYATGLPGEAAVYQHPPDLPNLEFCQSCHSARPWWQSGEVRGGVAQRCTECHTYHNIQHGLQGRGARTLPPAAEIDKIDEFLRPSKGWEHDQPAE